jgi:hypothetical protein
VPEVVEPLKVQRPLELGWGPSSRTALTHAVDRFLDWVILAFAVWTVLVHVAFALELTRDTTILLWLIGTPLAIAVDAAIGRTVPDRARSATRLPRTPILAAYVTGAVATAFALAGWRLTRDAWPLIWLAVVAVLAIGILLLWTSLATHYRQAAPDAPNTTGIIAILFLALLLALMSAFTIRPEVDDTFVVNRATYIEHNDGPFPERDTIFSNEEFKSTRDDIPQTSIEPFYGSIAALLPIAAVSVAHLLAGPAISALGVLSLWRLLRSFRVRFPAIATFATYIFFLWDGDVTSTFGNFNWTRAWLGKVALLIVVIPFLWTHGLAWGRRADRRSLAFLAIGGAAAVGLSTTGTFVAPAVMGLAIAAGALAARQPLRILGVLVAAIYPLGAALARQLAEPQPLQMAVGRFFAQVNDIGVGLQDENLAAGSFYRVFGMGVGAFIAFGSALLAWLFVRDLAARIALLAAPAVLFFVFFFPGLLGLLDEITSADAILWRVVWIVPVPAAIGICLTAPMLLLPDKPREAVLAAIIPVVLIAALAIWGTPVVSRFNVAKWDTPGWDLIQPETASAQNLVALVPEGGVVGTPWRVGYPLAVISHNVKATNPLPRYLNDFAGRDDFGLEERELLTDVLTWGVAEGEEPLVAPALQSLSVVGACQYKTNPKFEAPPPEVRDRDAAIVALSDAGFVVVGEDEICRLWLRNP